MVAADRGVGVDVGVLEVTTDLEPGRGYHLPRIGVINTGDEVTTYAMSIGFLAGQPERRPDEAWFTFDPPKFSLAPGTSADVVARLVVPTDADTGEYFALVRAQTVAQQATGTSLGVAAATKLTFTVAPSGWLDSQRHRVNRWLYEWAPWTYLVPGALLLGWLVSRAGGLPFRLRVERK